LHTGSCPGFVTLRFFSKAGRFGSVVSLASADAVGSAVFSSGFDVFVGASLISHAANSKHNKVITITSIGFFLMIFTSSYITLL
jgi:hypothetical protein